MKVNELGIVGAAVSVDGDVFPLVAYKNAGGMFTVYRNNDVFGIQMLIGLESVELECIEQNAVNDIADILRDPDFAGFQGVAKIDGGLLLVEDFDSGACGTITGIVSKENYVPFDDYVDSGEFEDFDECPYYDRLMDIF